MRKVLFGIAITLLLFFLFQYWQQYKNGQEAALRGNQLIQEQVQNVGKLIVTEGHFSEVYNYEDQKSYFSDYFNFEKKALVVVNAEVFVAYDLSELEYEIDQENKVLRIVRIPKEELKIHPTVRFYDTDESVFNPFTGDDYNEIQAKAKEMIRKKIEKSSLKANAQNRLLSELSKFYILTNSLGWTLQYNGQPVDDLQMLRQALPID